MYLRSPLFQAQLRAIVVGTTIPNVSLPDLRKLPVAAWVSIVAIVGMCGMVFIVYLTYGGSTHTH
jgi:hypothetical protein